MSSETLVKVSSVSKKFCRDLKTSLKYGLYDIAAELNPLKKDRPHAHDLREGEFWAVKDVSFELKRGECLGLIGHNGAGKTTLLKMLNGLIKPDTGRIEMNGRVGALIALGAGFNPILTGRENIYVNGSVLGLTKREIDDKLEEIIDFAEIRDAIDAPVQSYSSGMSVRLGFAIASALQPDVLLLDEVLSVGDVGFSIKCLQRMRSIAATTATIFVSHNLQQVGFFCSRIALMQRGAIIIDDEAKIPAITMYQDLVAPSAPVYSSSSGMLELFSVNEVASTEAPVMPVFTPSQAIRLRLKVDYRDASEPASGAVHILNFSQTEQIISYHLFSPNGNRLLLLAGKREVELDIKCPPLTPGKYYWLFSLSGVISKQIKLRVQSLSPFIIDGLAYGFSKFTQPAPVKEA